jgi:adenylate cyclase
MGGYIGSTGYINYGIAALNGILIFYKTNRIKFAWFFIYLATAIILYFLDPLISEGSVPLSDSLTVIMFLNNFILISGMVMISASYFLNIIRKEKLKSDLLIRSILPEAVVNELNENSRSNPILVPQATIIFMDFVGFTQITQSLEPHQLVAELNKHFTVFDKVFKSHKVEKLKTIGDAYMAVGGLPEPNSTHPLDVALAAMRIIAYLDTTAPKDHLEWKVRIGIHTGSVIAGIIGETKFSYDVWGGNVNLCSRLESAGKPGQINVSKEFMECTRDFFEFEDRGFIEIKHSEPVHMFFLIDIKSSLKAARFQPNNKFFELYKDFSIGSHNSINAASHA